MARLFLSERHSHLLQPLSVGVRRGPTMDMPDCTSHRVARRFSSSIIETAVLAHVDRDGVRWGWFTDDTPGLHLVPFDLQHRDAARVCLEDGLGNRSFQIDLSTIVRPWISAPSEPQSLGHEIP